MRCSPVANSLPAKFLPFVAAYILDSLALLTKDMQKIVTGSEPGPCK